MVVLEKILGFLKSNWIRMLVSFLVGLGLMAAYNAVYAGQGQPSWTNLHFYRDGSFIAAATIFFIGLLAIVANLGFFDIFSYYIGRKTKDDGKKENYGEYSARKTEERGKFNPFFLSYIIIALVFLTFSLILFFTL